MVIGLLDMCEISIECECFLYSVELKLKVSRKMFYFVIKSLPSLCGLIEMINISYSFFQFGDITEVINQPHMNRDHGFVIALICGDDGNRRHSHYYNSCSEFHITLFSGIRCPKNYREMDSIKDESSSVVTFTTKLAKPFGYPPFLIQGKA